MRSATEPLLATYSYLASARADFLRRLGRSGEARMAYEEALLLSENAVERAFLPDRLGQLELLRSARAFGTGLGACRGRRGRR